MTLSRLRLGAIVSLALIAEPALAQVEPSVDRGPLYDGAVALEAGRLDEAVAQFRSALTTQPTSAWFNLCLAHYASGALGDAIDACYHALGDPELGDRVVAVLGEIREAMEPSHRKDLETFFLPEPFLDWYRPPEKVLAEAVDIARIPPPTLTDRLTPMMADPDPVAPEPVAAALIGRFRIAAPPLPYRIPARRHDYSRGYDLEAKTGLFYYAPDTSPVVFGARASLRRQWFGARAYNVKFVEYLAARDGRGGVGSIGIGGGYENSIGGEFGFSVPWGRDYRRPNAMFPNHSVGIHADLRFRARFEAALDQRRRITFEASITGSVNIPKLGIALGHALGDICTEDDCPKTPDSRPLWPMTYWMVNLAIGFGERSGYPRYDHSEIWAPIGGPPP